MRANYRNLKLGIHETTKYLELFLKNLLLNEKNELRNRDMYIGAVLTEKTDIVFEKTGHSNEKPDIGDEEPDIWLIIHLLKIILIYLQRIVFMLKRYSTNLDGTTFLAEQRL